MLNALSKYSKCKHLRPRHCLVGRISISERSWQFVNLRYPPAIVFAFTFESEMHRETSVDKGDFISRRLVREVRQATLNAAFDATPHRFKGVRPCLKPMPTAAWIKPSIRDKKTPETKTILHSKFMTQGVAKSLTRSALLD